MKKSIIYLLGAICITSCAKEEIEINIKLPSSGLVVDVRTKEASSRAIIEGEYLPDGSEIGVALTNSEGMSYEGISYQNLKYTASGENSAQLWSTKDNSVLTSTWGNVYAYYPYNDAVTHLNHVPISISDQTDFMYATPVVSGVNAGSPRANLMMNHACSAIRLAIKKDGYLGEGDVSKVSVCGSSAAQEAVLDATTGKLSNFVGGNNQFSLDTDKNLSEEFTNIDIIVIPTGTESALTYSLIIDGITFTASTSNITLEQGCMYEYKLFITDYSVKISGGQIIEWDHSEQEDIDLGGQVADGVYAVT